MPLTFFGWLIVASAIAMLLLYLLRSRGVRREQPDLESYKARLEDIGARLKKGELNEAEADAARLALVSQSPSSRWGIGQILQNNSQKLLVAAAVFLVSGIGAAISYVGTAPETTRSQQMTSISGPDDEMATRLTDYVRSIGTEQPLPKTEGGELLPDVNAMIERLAARLDTAPQDIEGWQLLGWSYFQTGRYEQAATAFARALELDPSSAELKRSRDEAEARASKGVSAGMAASLPAEAGDTNGAGPSVENVTPPEAMPAVERDAAIRSMVDGLALRLENSPRDADGWIHLMRSRVVLGETEVAATVSRKALGVFVDDAAASAKIKAAAIELGLKAE
jgi:cytochrome c-type biogenesis protein CcmH/NrfG